MECCFIVAVESNPRLFSSVVVFFPFDFPAALLHSPQTAQPLPPESRHGVFFGADYHVANRSKLFLRIRAKFAFIPGFRSWCLARCCAALSPLPPPAFSSFTKQTRPSERRATPAAPSMTSWIGTFGGNRFGSKIDFQQD